MKMRLEAIDARHADTVALVLMAVKEQQDGPVLQMTRAHLLAAARVSERQWQVSAADGPVTMLPFTSLVERPYTTYVKVV